MPYTPYHFGPSGFVALTLRRWIDVPVFVLANVVVDIEVLVINLLHLGYPIHRYCHTLIGGAAAGALWGLAAYLLLRQALQSMMTLLRIRYKSGLVKMIISGILGTAFHILIDGLYHYDARAFWPSRTSLRRLTGYIEKDNIEIICLCFFLAVAVLYIHAVVSFQKSRRMGNNENAG